MKAKSLINLTKRKEFIIFIVIILISITYSFASPYFLTWSNMRNIILQSCIFSIVSFGALFVILIGGIDLSLGSIVCLCNVIMVKAISQGYSFWLWIPIVFLLSASLGAVNGFIVGKAKIHPFLVTLGMMYVARGLAYLVTEGRTIPLLNEQFKQIFSGFPISFIYVIIALILFTVLLSITSIGRKIYAVGSNPVAANLSGINVFKVQMFCFIVAGLCCGLAALMGAARVGSASPNYGQGFEVEAITAVILGGASFSGGRGTPIGTFLGAILVVVLMNGMTLLGVNSYVQIVVQGSIIVFAVYIDTLNNKLRSKD